MIFTACVVLAALTGEADFQLQTTDGQTYYGDLATLDADGVSFETSPRRVTVPWSRLSDISRVNQPQPAAAKASAWIELVDGSQLVASRYTVKNRTASIQLPDEQTIDLPTKVIAFVRFQQFEGALESQWEKITSAKAAGDLIVVLKTGALDYQPGVLGDVSEANVDFTLDDEKLSVKRSKVAAFVYYHAASEDRPKSICQLSDASGSRWEVAAVKLAKGALAVTTPAGIKRDVPLEAVVSLTARVQFLSDLQPESAAWLGYVSGPNMPPGVKHWFRPRFNEAADGGDLKIGGTVFAKGVALCSQTELVYRLPPGEFRRLTATAGIDSRGRPGGAVRLMIYGDGKSLLKEDVSASDEPLAIDVNLTGVSRLRIVVGFGPGGEVMDWFDLCDARILQ